MSVTGLTRGLDSGLLMAVERLDDLLDSSLLMAVERLDDLLGCSLLITVERLNDLLDSALLMTVERDEERLLSGCIAGPAAGNPSTIILLLLLLLFDAIAGPATGSASWASNRCAGKQLKLVNTTKAVAESLIFIFFNNLCFINLLQMHATGMPSSINQIDVQTIDNCD
ncbi:MAG: hypothetical protein RMY16_06465 [Nostoc sp. DedQUE12b]|uniref:hypothetical protein n=1 Tax=Nostoc sp. DedQUE12b TaxID=3075398 RepID=UPI002AD4409E|nr:hypothetical protein [Nostoc sp. DedQUE12b]MDZ8085225.1 hypothetical protein [Nostoc sp. DedQUE12b]